MEILKTFHMVQSPNKDSMGAYGVSNCRDYMNMTIVAEIHDGSLVYSALMFGVKQRISSCKG